MAIAPMQKVMIVAHRSQAGRIISALQNAGIIQILDAERAMVSKEWPELEMEINRPKDTEELIVRLDKTVAFLKKHAVAKDGRSVFQPLIPVNRGTYTETVLGSSALILLDGAERTQSAIEKLSSQAEAIHTEIQRLLPWKDLQTSVEELAQLKSTVCLAGILPNQHFRAAVEKLTESEAAVQTVGSGITAQPCLVFCMKESAQDIQKTLRLFEFEPVSFEGVKGTIDENLTQRQDRLEEIYKELKNAFQKASQLAGEKLKLEILADYYHNFLARKQTQATAPASETTLFLEGWVKKKDYTRLTKILKSFDGADLAPIEPAEGEEIPVEIENASMVRPFETITRLYGMPISSSVDPTIFLAPFFAIFFGLCMADAGYGLVMMALLAWALKKTQGDKKILWMLLICGITTFLAGVITGSWFGDAITALLGENSTFDRIRQQILLFDPMKKPMIFFMLSLGLGYLQIQFGLFIAFFANVFKKDFVAAIFDQLAWIVMLNCLVCLGLSQGGVLPVGLGKLFGLAAIVPAVAILVFSGRGMGLGGRLGFGAFQLFSTVFYMGDILSYVRLMALGMVGSGFGMAINILVKLVMDVPYFGWLLGLVLFIGGHSFNLAMSMLGAFVHSLRLQFVEFFPKFFIGGGQDFVPLRKEYRHIQIKE